MNASEMIQCAIDQIQSDTSPWKADLLRNLAKVHRGAQLHDAWVYNSPHAESVPPRIRDAALDVLEDCTS